MAPATTFINLTPRTHARTHTHSCTHTHTHTHIHTGTSTLFHPLFSLSPSICLHTLLFSSYISFPYYSLRGREWMILLTHLPLFVTHHLSLWLEPETMPLECVQGWRLVCVFGYKRKLAVINLDLWLDHCTADNSWVLTTMGDSLYVCVCVHVFEASYLPPTLSNDNMN